MQETRESRVQSLGGEDALDEGMTTHSSILAWRISWTEEPGGLHSMGSQRARHDRMTEYIGANSKCSAASFLHPNTGGIKAYFYL